MTDRPINSRGFYNLNFVDWNNEWERVLDEDPNSTNYEFTEEGEFYDKHTYKKVMKNVKEMKIGNTQQTCSICMTKLTKQVRAVILKCKHAFHSECFKPWIKKHNTCPNCREDLV